MELKLYTPSPATDILLANWWAHMGEKGELEGVFTSEYALLSRFMAGFQAPTILFYAEDVDGICYALWADPIMSGAFFGLWMREDRRPSAGADFAEAHAVVCDSLTKMLAIYPILFLVTRDIHIVHLGVRLGAKTLGAVPHVFEGESAFLCYLTREDFAAYKAQGENHEQGWQ